MGSNDSRAPYAIVAVVAVMLVSGIFAGSAGARPQIPAKQDAASPINIGGLWDLSGAVSTVITAIYRSTELAISEANQHGGINGHLIKLTSLDDASDPATGVANYQKLVHQDGIQVILGPDYTPVSLAVATLAAKDHVLTYSSGGTATQLTTPTLPYAFAVPPTAAAGAISMVKFIKSMKKTKIGLIEQADAFGSQYDTALTQDLASAGLPPIASKQSIPATAIDATSQVVAMKNAGVDVVIDAASENPTDAIVKAAYQQSLGVPIVANQAGYQPSVVQLLTTSAPIQFYVATPLNCPVPGANGCATGIINLYHKRFGGQDPPVYGIVGYVGAQAFIAALRHAKSYTADGIKKALETAPAFKSAIMPPIKFSATNHRGVNQQLLVGYNKGKVVYFGSLITKNQLKTKK